jgi:hypothetical protein
MLIPGFRSISIAAGAVLSSVLRARLALALLACVAAGCGGDALQADECPVPSSCGDRKYCDSSNTSICIRSAEGVNRCGLPPSSCGVKLCTTSADCESLGSGYFCDTPNSGCCSDGERPRCVATPKAGT